MRVEGLAPRGARVVDEDVDSVGLEAGEGGRELDAGVVGLEVGWDGYGGAAGGFAWRVLDGEV